MDYVGLYLSAEIKNIQTKRVFVDILPTSIKTTQSSRYLVDSQWLVSVELQKRVEIKYV